MFRMGNKGEKRGVRVMGKEMGLERVGRVFRMGNKGKVKDVKVMGKEMGFKGGFLVSLKGR